MKSLIYWIAEKYILSSVNELLEKNADNVKAVHDRIEFWSGRLESLTALLKKLNAGIEDAKLTDEEIEGAVSDARALLDEMRKDD